MAYERKAQLSGGTIRVLMVAEIRRVMAEIGEGGAKAMQDAANILGVTQRTLYKITGPLDKGGWPEFQVTLEEGMAKVIAAAKSKPKQKKVAPKKTKPSVKKK